MAGVDVATLYTNPVGISLWEGTDGLLFYDPPVSGDRSFYRNFYRRWNIQHDLSQPRAEFFEAARLVRPGDRVLDVGCGSGAFGHALQKCQYLGIDPTYSGLDARRGLIPDNGKSFELRQVSIEAHVAENPTPYDVVSAFHVVEHVADPIAFVHLMVQLLKPGGQLMIAVPKYPSPMYDIPGFPINMPPHHLTFWTELALRRLAKELGLLDEQLIACPVESTDQRVLWIRTMSIRGAGEDFMRLDAAAMVSLVLANLFGTTLGRLISYPTKVEQCLTFLLVARKRNR